MKKNIVFTLFLSLLGLTVSAQLKMDDSQINALIKEMTLEEKVSMVHGEKGEDKGRVLYVGYLPGISRLGIPSLRMQNGGSGAGASFNAYRHLRPATAFPTAVAQASTWNKSLLYELGKALALETKAQECNVLLAPMINIIRVPEGGRNFELFSEDPYLSARCAVEVIKGIQDMGVIATAKSLAANNQETWRRTVNELISERALREIYLPSFEASIKEAKVASLMTAYNFINGNQSSEYPGLLRQIIKDEWNYKGFIMTDWDTNHQTIAAANAGLDMEMPGWKHYVEPKFKNELAEAVKSGKVKMSTLDEMVYRILQEMKRFGFIGEKKDYPEGALNTRENRDLARNLAIEGAVLLKNDKNILPLNSGNLSSVALFGDADKAYVSGGGSSQVFPFYSVTPKEGLQMRLPYAKVIHYQKPEDATGGDIAIIFISRVSKEGKDRQSISLDEDSDLINQVTTKYKHTIVMLRTPGAYTIPWLNKVDAVFQMWYPGQEEGNAESALLLGDANPSGKLPVTFGKRREDFIATTEKEFPGINETVNYSEGIFVGYRHFDLFGIEPLFPFGYGLSYTTFEYSNLRLSSRKMRSGETLQVSYTIKNTGQREGAEISQLYIRDPEASVQRPAKELKGFDKVFLNPGESKTVEQTINQRDLSFWDEKNHQWTVEKGRFDILIGASANDIRLKDEIEFSK